jgi:hypothetical protein
MPEFRSSHDLRRPLTCVRKALRAWTSTNVVHQLRLSERTPSFTIASFTHKTDPDAGRLLGVVFEAVVPVGVVEPDREHEVPGERQPVAAGRQADHAVPGGVAVLMCSIEFVRMEPAGARPPIRGRLPGPLLQAQHIPLPANGSAKAMSVLFEYLEDCRDSFFARPVPLEFDRIGQRADGDGARLHHTLDS